MTLKLVSDNTVELPVANVGDIAAELRALGDAIESGEHEATSAIIVTVRNGGLTIFVRGENCSPYELMGLFEAAKLRVFADDAIEE